MIHPLFYSLALSRMIFLHTFFASLLFANFAFNFIFFSFTDKQNIFTIVFGAVNQIRICYYLLLKLKPLVFFKNHRWHNLFEFGFTRHNFTPILGAFDFGESILVLNEWSICFFKTFWAELMLTLNQANKFDVWIITLQRVTNFTN